MASLIASPRTSTDDRRLSKDLPHLSLSVESPPSPSPFPSPSSSFIPPPMPGAHEFANKAPPGYWRRDSKEHSPAPAPNGHSKGTAPGVLSPLASPAQSLTPAQLQHPHSTPAGAQPPQQQPTQPPAKRSSLPLAPPPSAYDSNAVAAAAELRSKHASLILSPRRPAPASPTASRRASAAPSNASTSSASASATHPHRLSTRSPPPTPTQAQQKDAQKDPQTKRRAPAPIKIRDFAYAAGDARHTGEGPDAPRAAHSRASGAHDAEPESGSRRGSGWGPFRWGLGVGGGRFWGLGGRATPDERGFVPTRSDFARNFDSSPAACEPAHAHSNSGSSASSSGDDDDDDDEEDDDDDAGGVADPDAPLLPGLYRALYAFEPEGGAEMRLDEDQLVRVIGRGGGVGWAIAVRGAPAPDGGAGPGGHALVPESYLEPVRLDNEDDGDGDGEEGATP